MLLIEKNRQGDAFSKGTYDFHVVVEGYQDDRNIVFSKFVGKSLPAWKVIATATPGRERDNEPLSSAGFVESEGSAIKVA